MTEPNGHGHDDADDETVDVEGVVFVGFFLAHQQQFDQTLQRMFPQASEEERRCYRRGFTLGFLSTAHGLRGALEAAEPGLVTTEMIVKAYLDEADRVRHELTDVIERRAAETRH